MDRVKGADGHTRWILGPVEMSIVAAIPTLLLVLLGYQVNRFAATQEKQGDALVDMAKQLAVNNVQVAALMQQFADVPGLTQGMAEIRVQVERNSDDIKELRAVRGLK